MSERFLGYKCYVYRLVFIVTCAIDQLLIEFGFEIRDLVNEPMIHEIIFLVQIYFGTYIMNKFNKGNISSS